MNTHSGFYVDCDGLIHHTDDLNPNGVISIVGNRVEILSIEGEVVDTYDLHATLAGLQAAVGVA